MLPRTLITFEEMRKIRREWSASTVALVPTMGALHAGHVSLVRKAKELADRVVVSIFVNPLQFGPTEDFARYPRTLGADLELLAAEAVDAVFTPNAAEMYPDAFQTKVINLRTANILCGRSRPGHFDGVLTVVAKLFGLVSPTWGIFGKKDYQQWRLIEQMVTDLAMNVRIIGCEILRESDGLAMSSRNRYLPPDQRAGAPKIFQGLSAAQEAFRGGTKGKVALLKLVAEALKQDDAFSLDYIDLRSAEHLEDIGEEVTGPAVILVAANYHGVRLIDNLELIP